MFLCFNIGRLIKRLAPAAALAAAAAIVFFAVGRASGSSESAPADAPKPLPVIMYHSVREGSPSKYVVTPAQLEADLKKLSDDGYVSVSAEELVRYTLGLGELPEKPVLITFDDGFYNNLSLALPLFEKYDMRFVVSIVGRYVDSLAASDPHIDDYSYLTWNDVSALIASGRAEIGNHTYDMHSSSGARKGCSRAPGETEEEYRSALFSDVYALQNEIREETGCVPFVFAYPFGAISKESVPVLKEAGFLVTLNCYERVNHISRDPDCLYGLGRFNRSGLVSTEEFFARLS